MVGGARVRGRVEAVSAPIIDSDEHLYEPRSLWVDHIDSGHRADALTLEDDELGYTWLAWRGQRLELADVHQPGDVEDPRRLTSRSGDLFTCCSDFPHSEGTATPLADYTAAGCDTASSPGLFHNNVTFLLGPS